MTTRKKKVFLGALQVVVFAICAVIGYNGGKEAARSK